MTNEQINETIHVWMGRGCYHDIDSDVQDGEYIEFCTKEECAAQNPDPSPDYCSSLDAVADAEKKVVEEFGWDRYVWAIGLKVKSDHEIVTASASQRATAIFNLITEEK